MRFAILYGFYILASSHGYNLTGESKENLAKVMLVIGIMDSIDFLMSLI